MADSITEDGFGVDDLGPAGESSSPVAALGRISGKLLRDNLTRNGINLAFETSLLYLDVNNNRIGVRTASPTHDLQNVGTMRVSNMIVDNTLARVENVKINTNGSITTLVGALNIVPTGGPTTIISHERVITDTLDFNDNYIRGLILDRNFEFRPDGTGDTNVNANTLVDGTITLGTSGTPRSLFAQKNVNIRGILTIGNDSFDTLTVVPDFTQSIIPGDDSLYDLGTISKKWRYIYAETNNPIDGFTSVTATISDQVRLATNQITTLQSNDDLFLTSDEGTVTLENISIKDDTITNLLNSAITLASTGNGYLQFSGNFGFQLPAGDISERPVAPVTGTTRWNTELDYLECYDGTVWAVSTGGGGEVTEEIAEDFGHRFTLIFG